MIKKSNWKPFPKPEPDVILSLLQRSIQDKRENKVNMTAGIYRDDDLKPFLLHSVNAALHTLGQRENLWFSTEPGSEGDEDFTKHAVELMLGTKEPTVHKLFDESRIAAVHCQSGGTGLYIAFELAKKLSGTNTVYISDPSWPIHNQMADFHGFNIKLYPYYNFSTNDFNFEGMIECIKSMDEGAVFLIQPCGHNPTGYDPTKEQWKLIITALCERKALVLFDTAYFGFATGDLDNDAYPVRLMVNSGRRFLITQSYSKNFGLYSARVGFIAVICDNKAEKEDFEEHMRSTSQILYGSPSNVGSEIIKEILKEPELYNLWLEDLKIMSGRIADMRRLLYEEILKYKPKRDWSFLIKQIGMFAYTGLTKDQVNRLIDDYAIYLIHSGRISICGLNKENIPYVAKSFFEVTEGTE